MSNLVNFNIKFCDFISLNHKFDKPFNLERVKPVNRRRLSNCAKSVFSLTNDLTLDMPVVFSSNLGEINRFFDLLSKLKYEISPTSFSLSVLNAIPAILGIESKNSSEILAISATASLEVGIINALKYEKALVISYFEGIDKEYYKENPYYLALALIVERGDEFSLGYEICQNEPNLGILEFIDNYKKSKIWHSFDGSLKWTWYENN